MTTCTHAIATLITKLQQGSMLRDEILQFLNAAPSTWRKYAGKMEGLLVPSYDFDAQQLRYSLTSDRVKVQAFLDQAAAMKKGTWRPTAFALALRNPHRHFHIMPDDIREPIKVQRIVIARDSLVSALFGPAREVHA